MGSPGHTQLTNHHHLHRRHAAAAAHQEQEDGQLLLAFTNSLTAPSLAGGALRLPLIKNKKTVNPRDSSTEPVFQLVRLQLWRLICFGF